MATAVEHPRLRLAPDHTKAEAGAPEAPLATKLHQPSTRPAGSHRVQPPGRAVAPGLIEPLSTREMEVLGLLAAGRPNQTIADELVVTVETVMTTAPGWRRVAAFAVDYAVILPYLGLLVIVGVVGRAVGAVPTDITTPAGRVAAQLVAFAVLTVPVTLWFAGWEAGRGGATPGKRLLGLRVRTIGGGPLAWPRSLGRTVLKFTVPWELAHTAVWDLLVWPGERSAVLDAVLLSLANAVIAVDLVSLFVGSRRTPYDRIAGTVVTAADGSWSGGTVRPVERGDLE